MKVNLFSFLSSFRTIRLQFFLSLTAKNEHWGQPLQSSTWSITAATITHKYHLLQMAHRPLLNSVPANLFGRVFPSLLCFSCYTETLKLIELEPTLRCPSCKAVVNISPHRRTVRVCAGCMKEALSTLPVPGSTCCLDCHLKCSKAERWFSLRPDQNRRDEQQHPDEEDILMSAEVAAVTPLEEDLRGICGYVRGIFNAVFTTSVKSERERQRWSAQAGGSFGGEILINSRAALMAWLR